MSLGFYVCVCFCVCVFFFPHFWYGAGMDSSGLLHRGYWFFVLADTPHCRRSLELFLLWRVLGELGPAVEVGRDGWLLVLLLSGRAWRRDGMGGVMAEEWVLFRLFPPLGCFSSTEFSRPRRLGVFEREGVESRQILERTGSVRRGGSIKGRARVPPSRHTPHHDMADNIKHQTKTRKKDFGKHISWIRRPWTSFRRNIP